MHYKKIDTECVFNIFFRQNTNTILGTKIKKYIYFRKKINIRPNFYLTYPPQVIPIGS